MNRYAFDKEKHLHTLEGKPLTGTSSVSSVISKPLTWWAAGLAVSKLGWSNPKLTPPETRKSLAGEVLACLQGIDVESYLSILDGAYRAHSEVLKQSADKGTDLHAELENWVKWKMGKVELEVYDPKIEPFIEWANENIKAYLWSEAHCYSERIWCGGITDLGVELNDGTYAIVDFKSSKEAYDSQFIQASGYAIQVEENGLFSPDGSSSKKLDKKIGALIIVPFGAKKVVPEVKRNVEEYKRAFEAAVVLYRLLNK